MHVGTVTPLEQPFTAPLANPARPQACSWPVPKQQPRRCAHLRCVRREARLPRTQVFALLPPGAHNLAAYVAWASALQQLPLFLAGHAAGALRVEVPAGATLLIPGAAQLRVTAWTICRVVWRAWLECGSERVADVLDSV